jgi:hypothetical protein
MQVHFCVAQTTWYAHAWGLCTLIFVMQLQRDVLTLHRSKMFCLLAPGAIAVWMKFTKS